jgi:RNA:NAD 2'-phosphotransferase (TPT1/KptA family)
MSAPPEMPKYLYHATSEKNGEAIAKDGLQPRSKGGQPGAYLCMSGSEKGATTLGAQASDIIFRVDRSKLIASSWNKRGAGKEEWQSKEGIPAASLEYRRNLGNEVQKTWRKASLYPRGLDGKPEK